MSGDQVPALRHDPRHDQDSDTPPALTAADLDAERAVLGAVMLTNGRTLDELDLRPDAFYRPAHTVIAETCIRLHAQGRPVDAVTVAATLGSDLHRIGGPLYLHECISAVPTVANAGWYWRQILNRATRRLVAQTGIRMTQLAGDDDNEAPEAILDRAREVLDAAHAPIGDDLPDTQDAYDEAVTTMDGGGTRLPTPWADLNDYLGGWRPGVVYTAAARPGEGKSLLGLGAAEHAAKTGPVILHSLEMPRGQVMARRISATTGIPLATVLGDKPATPHQWEQVARVRGDLTSAPLVIDDRTGITPADIRQRARAVRSRLGQPALVVVDYLQLLNAPLGRRYTSTEEEVAAISRALKLLAMDLHVPVLLLAQLNREVERRGGDRTPRLSDLRGSGAIEQDSDVVLLMQHDDEKEPDLLRITVGKNRHGPKGPVTLNWDAGRSRLTSRAWTPHDALHSA